MCLLVLKNDWSLVEVNDEIKQNFFDLIRVPVSRDKLLKILMQKINFLLTAKYDKVRLHL